MSYRTFPAQKQGHYSFVLELVKEFSRSLALNITKLQSYEGL